MKPISSRGRNDSADLESHGSSLEPGHTLRTVVPQGNRNQGQSGETGTSLPIEHCTEYDAAAEWCAKRGLKGSIGDALPLNMDSDGALRWINSDPEAFQERVRQFAYALAMEKPTTTEEEK